MGIKPSNRAEILKRVLSHINNGDYDEQNGYIVFGASSVWDIVMDLTDPPGERQDHSLEDSAKSLASDSKVDHGRAHAARRVSLGEPPNFKTNAFDNLRPEQRRTIRDLLEKALRERSASGEQQRTPSESEVADALEAAFAEEVLGKLPKIVSRASELDELEPTDIRREIPRDDVKKYFEEAHRCYLYGFPVACAVLCRAILESALAERIDPDSVVKQQTSRKESYMGRLVEEATKRNILTDDRPKCAIEVRDAGNDAIHDYGRFEKRLRDPLHGIGHIVDSTRKILIDLYSDGS
jgi:hypothetical protein